MSATRVQHPLTDHLWQLGFDVKSKVDRLPAPLVVEDQTLYCEFSVTVYPQRGQARRLFSRKGPARAEVKSNLPFEMFLAEQEQNATELKDTYTEKCAGILLDMLKAEEPSLAEPTASVT